MNGYNIVYSPLSQRTKTKTAQNENKLALSSAVTDF